MQDILSLITSVCLSTAQNVELEATYLKLQDLENRLIVSESQVDNLKEQLASKELIGHSRYCGLGQLQYSYRQVIN